MKIFLNRMYKALILVLLSGCVTWSESRRAVSVEDWQALNSRVVKGQIGYDQLRKPGPFRVKRYHDYVLHTRPSDPIVTDLYLSDHRGVAPLVLMVHGNAYSKEAHREQAYRLASWGFHCLTIDVPNRGEWVRNGERVEKITRLVHAFPSLVGGRIDPSKIILVGHSFGGSAVSIAAGRGAPVKGVILLDPAEVHPSVRDYLKKAQVPGVILGADPKVFRSKRRKNFYRYLAGPAAEVSVVDATHNDAQLPSITSVHWGFDPFTSRSHQETFRQALLVSAFSLASTGQVGYAWKFFQGPDQKKVLKHARARFSPRVPQKKAPAALPERSPFIPMLY